MGSRVDLLAEIREGARLRASRTGGDLTVGLAPKPFNLESPGDCILQSSEGVKFKIHRLLLTLISPIFSDMFSLPQKDDEELPTIELTESSDVVLFILQMVHPQTTPRVTSLELPFELLVAFDKYMIDLALLRQHVSPSMKLTAHHTELYRVKVYALAWRLGMQEEAVEASRYLHHTELTGSAKSTILERAQDLEALLALWDLRQRREEALDGFIEAIPWSTYRCATHEGIVPAQLNAIKKRLRIALRAPKLVAQDVLEAMDMPSVLIAPARIRSPTLPSFPLAKPSPGTGNNKCIDCRNALTQLSSETLKTRTSAVKMAIDAYPQTIRWWAFRPHRKGCASD